MRTLTQLLLLSRNVAGDEELGSTRTAVWSVAVLTLGGQGNRQTSETAQGSQFVVINAETGCGFMAPLTSWHLQHPYSSPFW